MPDLVVFGWNGGAHCCFVAWVLSLGGEFQILADVAGAHTEPVFFQADADAQLEVEVTDWTFNYWPDSFAGIPSVRVVLDWEENVLRPSVDLNAAPRPNETDLAAEAARLRSDPQWNSRSRPYGQVFSRALELLYSGHEDLAWSFIEAAWGGDPIRMIELVTGFGRRLERSTYFSDLEAARKKKRKADKNRMD